MSITLNESQVLLNCRLLAKYESKFLIADDKGTLHRYSKFGAQPFFCRDISKVDLNSSLPYANTHSDKIRPIILATLFGILQNFYATLEATGKCDTYFTTPFSVAFELVPALQECSYKTVLEKITADPLFKTDVDVLAVAAEVNTVISCLSRRQ